eukprot:1138154-Pelagomonas_calceolata.AAC.6
MNKEQMVNSALSTWPNVCSLPTHGISCGTHTGCCTGRALQIWLYEGPAEAPLFTPTGKLPKRSDNWNLHKCTIHKKLEKTFQEGDSWCNPEVSERLPASLSRQNLPKGPVLR